MKKASFVKSAFASLLTLSLAACHAGPSLMAPAMFNAQMPVHYQAANAMRAAATSRSPFLTMFNNAGSTGLC